MIDNESTDQPESSASRAFREYIRPLPSNNVPTERPVITGAAAIKATMLPEQGARSLSNIQAENAAALKNATPLPNKLKPK